jgi:hypothetical protein
MGAVTDYRSSSYSTSLDPLQAEVLLHRTYCYCGLQPGSMDDYDTVASIIGFKDVFDVFIC